MRRRAAGLGTLVAATLGILVLTLSPNLNPQATEHFGCVICGERWAADVILNVLLYVPLGALLPLMPWNARRSLLGAVTLSAAVELLQVVIPGRDPSLGDVLFNGLGAASGLALAEAWRRLRQPPARVASLLSVSCAAGALLVVLVTGYLLQLSLPASTYYGQWTPNLGHLAWYRGRVIEAAVGNLPVPSYRLPESERLRELLLNGAPIRVRGVAGPPVQTVGSLFSIADDRPREIVLVGVEREDLVFRIRRRTADARVDQPDLRLVGALAGLEAGDSLSVTIWREDHAYVGTVNGKRFAPIGISPGRAWGVLLYVERLPEWVRRVLDALWMMGLLLPFGIWLRPTRIAVGGGMLLLAGLAVLPDAVGLLPLAPREWLGGLFGVGLGIHLGRSGRGAESTKRSPPASRFESDNPILGKRL